jgi:hypothetical protein
MMRKYGGGKAQDVKLKRLELETRGKKRKETYCCMGPECKDAVICGDSLGAATL